MFKKEGSAKRWRGWKRISSVAQTKGSRAVTMIIDSAQIDLKDGAKLIAYGIGRGWRSRKLLAQGRYKQKVYNQKQRAIYLIGDSIVHTEVANKVGWGDQLSL